MVRIVKMADSGKDAQNFDDNYGWAISTQEPDRSELLDIRAEEEREKESHKRMNRKQKKLIDAESFYVDCVVFPGGPRKKKRKRG